MTILIATICDRFALVSQDSFVTDASTLGADARGVDTRLNFDDAGAAVDADLVGDGTPPTTVPLAFGTKFRAIPQLGMVIGCTGDGQVAFAWMELVARLSFARDIVELSTFTPMLLANLYRASGTQVPLAIVHVGYSRLEGACRGFVYNSAEDFKPVRLKRGHHLYSPVPSPDDADYDDLAARWAPAADGVDTESFHVKLAINQHRTYRRGLYRAGAGIGGQLHTASVDSEGGVRLWTAHEFPGFAEQSQDAHRRSMLRTFQAMGVPLPAAAGAAANAP